MQKISVQNDSVKLNRPINLSVSQTVDRVSRHYNSQLPGAERLPILAIYAVLTLLVRETARYKECTLLPLTQQHTDADRRQALVGDVHIRSSRGLIFEGYEIQHNTPITSGQIQSSLEKLTGTNMTRFYILTTYHKKDYSEFKPVIQNMWQKCGRELILDSFDRTLGYYLRLIKETRQFADAYASNVEADSAMTFELKQAWNEIIESRAGL